MLQKYGPIQSRGKFRVCAKWYLDAGLCGNATPSIDLCLPPTPFADERLLPQSASFLWPSETRRCPGLDRTGGGLASRGNVLGFCGRHCVGSSARDRIDGDLCPRPCPRRSANGAVEHLDHRDMALGSSDPPVVCVVASTGQFRLARGYSENGDFP